MSTRRLLPLLVVVALAGCLDGNDEEEQAQDPGIEAVDPVLPEDIQQTDVVVPGVDSAAAGQDPCTGPQDPCIRLPFTIGIPAEANETTPVRVASMVADLTWTVTANDLDMMLLKDGEQLVYSGASVGEIPPNEHIDVRLQPGNYELVIVPYATAADQYELSVTFSI